jgi:hypothetical protein
MKHRVVSAALALLGLLVAGLLGLLPRSTAAQSEWVTPDVGLPGTVFTFAASGFIDDEEVNYWIDVPDGTVIGSLDYEIEAGDEGWINWTWRAPSDAPQGYWQMVARGRESGVERVITFEISYTVPYDGTGDPTVPPVGSEQNVSPREGGPGTMFAFFAQGFNDTEWVGLWLNAPDGSVVSIAERGVYAYRGRADWTWRAPGGAMRGRWQMVARGEESGVERVLVFEVR